MILVVSVKILIPLTLSFFPFLLSEDAVVPLFNPRHSLSCNTIIAYEVRETGRAIAVHPESILRTNISGYCSRGLCCRAREILVSTNSVSQ